MSRSGTPLFTGTSRRRPVINLGGTSDSPEDASHTDIFEKAKAERKRREEARQADAAAVAIQSYLRSKRSTELYQARLKEQYQASLPVSEANILQSTRIVTFIVATNPSVFDKSARSPSPPSELLDLVQFLALHKFLFGSQVWTSVPGVLEVAVNNPWIVLIRRLALLIITRVANFPKSRHTPLFLQFLRQVLDADKHQSDNHSIAPCQAISIYLISKGLYENISKFLSSFTQPDASLIPTITISLLPFRALTAENVQERNLALSKFLLNILPLPHLFSISSPRMKTQLLQDTPFTSGLFSVVVSEKLIQNLSNEPTHHLYALTTNLIRIGDHQLKDFDGPNLSDFMTSIKQCLESLPAVPDSNADKATGQPHTSDPQDIEKDDSGDTKMDIEENQSAIEARNSKIQKARTSLAQAISPSFVLSLQSRSTRFSATSRPAFSGLVVSILQTFSEKKDELVGALVYYRSADQRAAPGGLLRELWKGWVRGSPLARKVGGDRKGSADVPGAITNLTFASYWDQVILLSELYSRALLTLGDDEFYSPGSRNPLSTDDVIHFSGLLRNICFALYWYENLFRKAASEVTVGAGKVTVTYLRELMTSLLGQIHARDSRRPFTPNNHWIMTSQFDLSSFLDTVVYEDQQIANQNNDDRSMFPISGRFPRRKTHFSSHQLNIISPRLGVLNNIPFVIPFESRVSMLSQFIQNDMKNVPPDRSRKATIRRSNLAEDAFSQLGGLGPVLKRWIPIEFIDIYGVPEAGIDGGGLFKELMTSLSKEVFDTDKGMWVVNRNNELYPAPTDYARDPYQLQWYKFLGQIVGKALHSGILIDAPFASFFVAKWLGRRNFLDDLWSMDPDLYEGLLKLKNYTGDVEADMALTFSLDIEEFGETTTVDLKSNGRNIPVTNTNRVEYITLISHYKLNVQIREQSEAFVSGLHDLVDARWLRMFNTTEMMKLVGGVEEPIDLEDLRRHTHYGNLQENEDVVRYFWDVVKSLDEQQKKLLIKFVTSCPRPPLFGFSELSPRFSIARGDADTSRLPTASTCVNLLKLPNYSSREILREKLLYAISTDTGFNMS